MSDAAKPKRTVLPNGTILDGRFEIVDLMGAGCFGAVYRARQLVFGRPFREVALKLFESDIVTPQNAREVFNDAIAVIGMQAEQPDANIDRHIVQIIDMGLLREPSPPRAFISMKLVGGGRTLDSEIRRYREDGMPVAASLQYLKQILVPLAWMHSLKAAVVHGDLKPDNILITENNELVVTDFGLAGRLPLGSIGGAVAYQAPESLYGTAAEAPADVYGLGLIWYEMLTGRHPFTKVGLEALGANDSRNYVEVQREARRWPIRPRNAQDDPANPKRIPPASEVNQELRERPQLERILNKCLTYNQVDRHCNARVLLEEIKRVEEGRPVDVTKPFIPKPPDPPPVSAPKASPDLLVADARSLLELGRHSDAIAKCEAALKLDARHVPTHCLLIRSRSAAGNFEGAKEACQRAMSMIHDNPDLCEAAADMFKAANRPGMAENLRKQAAELRQRPRRI